MRASRSHVLKQALVCSFSLFCTAVRDDIQLEGGDWIDSRTLESVSPGSRGGRHAPRAHNNTEESQTEPSAVSNGPLKLAQHHHLDQAAPFELASLAQDREQEVGRTAGADEAQRQVASGRAGNYVHQKYGRQNVQATLTARGASSDTSTLTAALAVQAKTSEAPDNSTEPHPGRSHDEAKYAFKESTDGVEGLRDVVEAVDAARDSAVGKANRVQASTYGVVAVLLLLLLLLLLLFSEIL